MAATVETTESTTRRRSAEELSPEAWLLKLAEDDPSIKEDKDFRYISGLAPVGVARAFTERHLPLIWSKLFPDGRSKKATPRPVTGEAEFQAFVDVLWARYHRMTGAQARSEAGALVAIFAAVKPKQLVEEAMTREQFGERLAVKEGSL
jgi:hypothetical protein